MTRASTSPAPRGRARPQLLAPRSRGATTHATSMPTTSSGCPRTLRSPASARKDLRNRLLEDALEAGDGAWILSGSIAGWETGIEPQFDCVVFLWVPTEIRLERLRRREAARFGEAALAPGGALHEGHAAFLEWAARYDTAGLEQRSRVKHEAWLATLVCHIVYIEGDTTVDERVTRILAEQAGRW